LLRTWIVVLICAGPIRGACTLDMMIRKSQGAPVDGIAT